MIPTPISLDVDTDLLSFFIQVEILIDFVLCLEHFNNKKLWFLFISGRINKLRFRIWLDQHLWAQVQAPVLFSVILQYHFGLSHLCAPRKPIHNLGYFPRQC